MKTSLSTDGNIIIRQEVVLPEAAAPHLASNGSAEAMETSPCETTEQKSVTAGISVTITYPVSTPATPAPNGKVTVRGRAEYFTTGATSLRAQCYLSTNAPSSMPEPPVTATKIDAPSGGTFPLNYEILDVPVVNPPAQNTVFVWAKFGTSGWYSQRQTFTPTASVTLPELNKSDVLAENTVVLNPPQALRITFPDDRPPAILVYNEFCSTPDQPVWNSLPPQENLWTFKTTVYEERLIGVLTTCSGGGASLFWINDDFTFDRPVALYLAGTTTVSVTIQSA